MRMTIEEYGRRFPDRPEPVPAEYLGHWIAWNEERTKIIAHGKTLSEVMRQAQAAECASPIMQKIPSGTFIGAV